MILVNNSFLQSNSRHVLLLVFLMWQQGSLRKKRTLENIEHGKTGAVAVRYCAFPESSWVHSLVETRPLPTLNNNALVENLEVIKCMCKNGRLSLRYLEAPPWLMKVLVERRLQEVTTQVIEVDIIKSSVNRNGDYDRSTNVDESFRQGSAMFFENGDCSFRAV